MNPQEKTWSAISSLRLQIDVIPSPLPTSPFETEAAINGHAQHFCMAMTPHEETLSACSPDAHMCLKYDVDARAMCQVCVQL